MVPSFCYSVSITYIFDMWFELASKLHLGDAVDLDGVEFSVSEVKSLKDGRLVVRFTRQYDEYTKIFRPEDLVLVTRP